jgi:uncharacterized coiled-coil protein SlyX
MGLSRTVTEQGLELVRLQGAVQRIMEDRPQCLARQTARLDKLEGHMDALAEKIARINEQQHEVSERLADLRDAKDAQHGWRIALLQYGLPFVLGIITLAATWKVALPRMVTTVAEAATEAVAEASR